MLYQNMSSLSRVTVVVYFIYMIYIITNSTSTIEVLPIEDKGCIICDSLQFYSFMVGEIILTIKIYEKIKVTFMQIKGNLYQIYKPLDAHEFVCVFFTTIL